MKTADATAETDDANAEALNRATAQAIGSVAARTHFQSAYQPSTKDDISADYSILYFRNRCVSVYQMQANLLLATKSSLPFTPRLLMEPRESAMQVAENFVNETYPLPPPEAEQSAPQETTQ